MSFRIDLEEWEHVTCMKTVALRSQETVSGLKGYIAAGTCVMQGEEVTCRGRVSVVIGITVWPLTRVCGLTRLLVLLRFSSWMWLKWCQNQASRSPRTSSKRSTRRNRRVQWRLCATAMATWCPLLDRRSFSLIHFVVLSFLFLCFVSYCFIFCAVLEMAADMSSKDLCSLLCSFYFICPQSPTEETRQDD